MRLSDIIGKSASAPSAKTDVWQDIIWELEVFADRHQMLADQSRSMIRWIKHMPRRDERRTELLEYLWREGSGMGEPLFEDFERIASITPKTKPKCTAAKLHLKGPKTPFMQEQLKTFRKYLGKMGYSGDASKLYAWAEKCWSANQTKWDLAKSAVGTRRGYSCSKALADAYRNLKSKQLAVL